MLLSFLYIIFFHKFDHLVTKTANPLEEYVHNIKKHLYKSDDLLGCRVWLVIFLFSAFFYFFILFLSSFVKSSVSSYTCSLYCLLYCTHCICCRFSKEVVEKHSLRSVSPWILAPIKINAPTFSSN